MVILALCALYTAPCPADEDGTIVAAQGAMFPDVAYKDEQGKDHQLKQDLGKMTIVHFWATWCVPCVAELPKLDAVAKQYAGMGLKVVDISEDGNSSMQKVKSFFAKNHIDSLSPYIDISTGAFKAAQARGLPTTYFLDATGKNIGTAEGPVVWESDITKDFITKHLK